LKCGTSISIMACLVATAACNDKKTTPAAPTPPPTLTLTPPTLDTPAAAEQLTTLRPTLTVRNGTSTQPTGTRMYDFQISDRNDFGASTPGSSFAVALLRTGIVEGTTGSTTFTVDTDLQPATRFYWRVRMTQGSTMSDWSASRTFSSRIVGFNRPGELYDPLVNGETVAELRFKRTTFFPGRGLRIDDSDSYARYLLAQTVTAGEFSVDVEGLSGAPVSENPDTAKLKVFSMTNVTTDIYLTKYICNTQYRGFNGNPDHAISFKCVFGDDDDRHKLEPDLAKRRDSVMLLNPASTYYWQATWGSFFRLVIQDGGVFAQTGNGGRTIYDYGQTLSIPGIYNPTPHYAYLGVNNSGSETGSWPGAIYRNVWIGNRTRPASLGSALRPQ
jgi:hypothetical protein